MKENQFAVAMDRRVVKPAPFSLVELAPQWVVKGVSVADGLLAPDPVTVASVREQCPYCHSGSLQLVLRKDDVIRSHLFCKACTRCFDCVDAQGNSQLTPQAVPIY